MQRFLSSPIMGDQPRVRLDIIRSGFIILFVLVCSACSNPTSTAPQNQHSQAIPTSGEWEGEIVILTQATPLRRADRSIDPGSDYRVFVAGKSRNGQIRITSLSDDVEGNVPQDRLIKAELAIKPLSASIDKAPNASDSLKRGMIRHAFGEAGPALSDFEAAIRIDPNMTAAYMARGLTLLEAGDYENAINAFEQASKLEPRSAMVLKQLAIARSILGDDARASADFERALAIAENDAIRATIYAARGSVRTQSERFEEALAEFGSAIELDGSDSTYLLDRAFVFRKLRQFDHSLADIERALRMEHENPRAFAIRGSIEFELKNYPKAIENFSEAIRLDPSVPQFWVDRGAAYDKLPVRDAEKAKSDYDMALSIDPDFQNALFRRGIWYREADEPQNAIADLDRAIEIDPGKAAYFILPTPLNDTFPLRPTFAMI